MRQTGFKFIDLPTAAERLATTRNVLLDWVTEGRIRPFSGSGQQAVFRAADVERLADQLGLNTPAPSATAPEESAPTGETPAGRTRKRDPIKLVSNRISMDSRWAEISDSDIATWLDALEPVQFDRIRKVGNLAVVRLQRLLSMLGEHERAQRPSDSEGD